MVVIPDEEDSNVYFKQYSPYILEEVRAGIDAEMKTIARKGLLPFIVTVNLDRLPEDDGESIVRLSCRVDSRELPKLDHGFYQEAVLVSTETRDPSRQRGRRFMADSAVSPLSGLLAIASVKRRFEEDDDDDEHKWMDMELMLPGQDVKAHVETWRAMEGQIKLHWLYGLIPSSRMYALCLSPPAVVFQEQFIRASLPEWPALAEPSNTHPEAIGRLNTQQREIVNRLVQVESGMCFLQGPPGTGKTTTAVSLLAQLRVNYPNKRILVTATTNQAVRVLLFNAMRLMPAEAMALTGVAKNIPEGLEDVFVQKYAHHLYQPFILLKRELRRDISSRAINELVGKIEQHYIIILKKLEALLTTETGMAIKREVREGVQRLQTELSKCHDLFNEEQAKLADAANRENIKDQLIEQIEASILLLQRTHYLESFLIQRAPLVYSTLISSGRDWLHKQVSKFDIVLIDEAAQSLVPEASLPLRFNPQICIHIGDPNQLPATVISKAALEGGYSYSMIHWLTKEFEQPHEMLEMQYRMLPEICEWPSQQYYSGRLVTAPEVTQRLPTIIRNPVLHKMFQFPCLFINISSGREQRYGSELSASISNPEEAKAVISVVSHLIMRCGIDAAKIGIITFYSAQLDLLKKEIKKYIRYEQSRKLTVSTVDGFQGEERDITLISVVRTSESVGFLNDPRRLNVAMTRAKEARWIFGFFQPLHDSNSDLPSLLQQHHIQKHVIEEAELRRHIRALP